MDFIAIDFETANEKRSSACSLGLVVVKNNVIVDKRHWYIKPTPNYYNPFNSGLHGIGNAQTCEAPNFDVVYEELLPFIKNNVVVAHNASFDISVFRHALGCYNRSYEEFNFACSYRLAQFARNDLPCYKLDWLALEYGLPLNHHDAVSDATACAQLFVALCNGLSVTSFDEMREKYKIQLGNCSEQHYRPFRIPTVSVSQNKRLTISELNDLDPTYVNDDFASKSFVFTGTLSSMTRERASTIVCRGGGNVAGGVSKRVDYLVCGIQDLHRVKDSASGKFKKAIELRETGHPIQIIDEDIFLQMIDEELLSAI